MLINLRGHDVRQILGVDFGELDPGIELQEGGFFVPKMDDVPAFALDDVEVLLDGNNTGECLLELPATVDAFLDFAEGHPAIKDRIDPRKLIRRIEQAAWVQARSDATEEGKFHWSAISQIFTLRRDLQHKHDRTENDSRKVAIREVLDAMDRIFPDPEQFEGEPKADSNRPPRDDVRTNYLRVIRALHLMAKLQDRGATTSVLHQLQELGFDSPKEDTVRKILDEARN